MKKIIFILTAIVFFFSMAKAQINMNSSGYITIGSTLSSTKPLWVIGQAKIGQNINGTAVIDAYGGNAYFGNNSETNGIAVNSTGNIAIGTTTDPGVYKIYAVNGASTMCALGSPGYGAGMFRLFNNNTYLSFSVSAYKFDNQGDNLLITRLGVNYEVSGADGITEFAALGSKKAPYIELNSEDGSISLSGENGTYGGDYRRPTNHLGVFVGSDGRVGIGTASNQNYELYINGASYNAIGYTGSDKKLKKEIKNLDKSALVNLLKLQGVSYKLINPNQTAVNTLTSHKDSSKMTTPGDAVADTSLYNTTQFGFIAQSVDSLYPNVVKTDSKGIMAINYTAFIPLIIEKLKELNTKTLAIDSLRLENANLQNHTLISNGGVYTVIWHSIPHQVLVYFDREVPRNPPHAHSANRWL
jgi:hypothetical protein